MKTLQRIILGIVGIVALLQLGGCAAAPYVGTVAVAYAVEEAKDPQTMGNLGRGISNFFKGITSPFSSPTEERAEDPPRVAWKNPDKHVARATSLPKILPGKKKVKLAPSPPTPEVSEPAGGDTAPAGHNSPAKKEQINPLSI